MKKKLGFILLLLGGASLAFWLAGRPGAAPTGAAIPPNSAPAAKQQVVDSKPPIPAPPTRATTPTPPTPQPTETPRPVFTSSVIPGAVMRTTPPATAKPPQSPASVAVPQPPIPEDLAVAEAETVALNIRHFGQRFGGNPTGTNAEIVKALTGDNEKGATYLPPDLKRLNENGELIDRWGTPYFFHANSATEMEVRSAGPDKTLYTPDDIVQH